MNAIELVGVSKSFGSREVLRELSLSVPSGTIHALLGANGAGKSTVIKILSTLTRPTSGEVIVDGKDAVRDARAVRQAIAVTGQSVAVDDTLTARENLIMFAELAGLDARRTRQRAAELLAQFHLSAVTNQRVGTFSGGMRRRLDIALSMVVPPKILILDEPTTGLDTRSRRELWQDIRALALGGTTIFLTTQYLEEADHLADAISLLDGGRIVATGTSKELKTMVGEVRLDLHDAQGALLASMPIENTAKDVMSVLAQAQPDSVVSIREPSLDDVFLRFTSDPSDSREATS